ncbi:hypothetical protein Tco_0595409 [Tanacetum coccineum]
MRSLLFTKNQTKPLTKHGNVLKDSFINVLTMASRNSTNFDTCLKFLYSKRVQIAFRILPRVAFSSLRMPRDGLAIIESKSKVRYSRSRPNDSRVITNALSSTSSPSDNSFEIQQMAALN